MKKRVKRMTAGLHTFEEIESLDNETEQANGDEEKTVSAKYYKSCKTLQEMRLNLLHEVDSEDSLDISESEEEFVEEI